MRTIVITGGTDGMGAALAKHYLTGGDRVIVIGRSREKFDSLVAATESPSRAEFMPVDLASIKDSRRIVDQLSATEKRIDVLILAASFIRKRRQITSEGHEASWALFFLSKYLFVTGLAPLLAKAKQPVVINTSVPGAKADSIDWTDLDMANGFSFRRSNAQQRRANELLGIAAIASSPDMSYVTWGPSGLVASSFAGDVGIGMRVTAVVLGTLLGQRPEAAVAPIIDLIDEPTPGRAAYRGAKAVPLATDTQSERDAERLKRAVADILGR